MLVYGDRSRREDARAVLDQLFHMAGASHGPSGPWIARHARRAGLLLRAAELVQGLDDAEALQADGDGLTMTRQVRAEGLRTLARLVLRSWHRQPLPDDAWAGALRPLAAACPDLAVTTKRGEGHAYYAVYPEAYGMAASRLAAAAPVVIGLRSIGTGLGAMVAARTRAPLFVTLRPGGDPFRRAPRMAADLRAALGARRGRAFAIVDEGPGLSGSSMAGCAAALEDLGVAPQRIVFLPSHRGPPGPAAHADVRARWRATARHVVTFDDMASGEAGLAAWVADLTGPALEPLADIGCGRWRDLRRFPQRPPGGGMRERRKFLLAGAKGTFLLRFAGLGLAGEATLRRARALSDAGFVPHVLGLRHGFLVERWLGEAASVDPTAWNTQRLVHWLAGYLAFRARRLPAGGAEGASLAALAAMAARNGTLLLGRPIEARPLAAAADKAAARVRRVATDGRLHAWEWLRLPGGRLLKSDAADHCCGHDLVGCQDIAWDVAGARIELGLDDDALAALLEGLARRGAPVDAGLLDVYTPCYAAFQAGSFSLDAEGAREHRERTILDRQIARYRAILEERLS